MESNKTTAVSTEPLIGNDILRAASLASIALGFVGNTLTYFIANAFKSQTSGTFFIKLLAIWDNLTIFFLGLTPTSSFGVSIAAFNDVTCKIWYFVLLLTANVANFIIGCLSLDRTIALWKPVVYKVSGKPPKAFIATFVVTCLWLAFVFPVATTVGAEGSACYPGKTRGIFPPQIAKLYFFLFQNALSFAIPSGVVMVTNALIIYKVKKSGGQVSKQEREISFSLVLVSICYLVSKFSMTFFWQLTVRSKSAQDKKLLQDATILMGCVDHSLNFIFYMLGSQTFRSIFWDLFKKTGKTPNAVNANQTNQNVGRTLTGPSKNSGKEVGNKPE